jgi:DNA uptake protein ComE-like DNA-binding protein
MQIRKPIAAIIIFQTIFQMQLAYGADATSASSSNNVASASSAPSAPPASNTATESFMVQKEEASAKAGSVYVTPTKKNEVLFKASIWGAVQYPGVHYMPLGTRLLDALSVAGGPVERADMENLMLSTHETDGVKVVNLSVSDALANSDYNPVLRPDDVLVVKEDRSTEKTALYLQIGTFLVSLIGVGLLIGQQK